ncbi:hypothetical protein OF365_02105 [Ureaplasma zalophigenitalium]|uniref:Uncharacterized protein n=2 Tax=Ureaplasma zalophigenitalium TaxID=907723 RepID=A0ABT3BQC8_9BACT|nr:hypothetical protein [Ureaplasma zalophigenitalium]
MGFLIIIPCLVACTNQQGKNPDDYQKNIYNFQQPRDIPYEVQSYHYPLDLAHILGNTLIAQFVLQGSSVVLELKLIKFYEPLIKDIFLNHKTMNDIAYLQMDLENEKTQQQVVWQIPITVVDLIKKRRVLHVLNQLNPLQIDTYLWKRAVFLDEQKNVISQPFNCLNKAIKLKQVRG